MSATIIHLSDRLTQREADLDIDLSTAVDVAIRDLREIEATWGTWHAFERLVVCQAMLRTVLAAS